MMMNSHEYTNNSSRNINYSQAVSHQLSTTEQEAVKANKTIDLIFIRALLLIAISFLIWRLLSNKASSIFSEIFQKSAQTNCIKCRYFNNNSYLKCAVHPSTVLKKEAQECSDYESKPQKNL